MTKCNAQVLSNMSWAFATLGQSDAQLFTALAREAERRTNDFSSQELATTTWAFAMVAQLDAAFLLRWRGSGAPLGRFQLARIY